MGVAERRPPHPTKKTTPPPPPSIEKRRGPPRLNPLSPSYTALHIIMGDAMEVEAGTTGAPAPADVKGKAKAGGAAAPPGSTAAAGPRFEVKKWNAVAMWSWAICTDTCAICRNNLYEPSIEYQVCQACVCVGGIEMGDRVGRGAFRNQPLSWS